MYFGSLCIANNLDPGFIVFASIVKFSVMHLNLCSRQNLLDKNIDRISLNLLISMVSHFQIMQTLGKNQSVNFSENSIAQMLRIIKKYVSKKWHVFHSPDKMQIRKLTLTSLITS